MPKDYAKQRSSKKRKPRRYKNKNSKSHWKLCLFTLLLLILFIKSLVWLSNHHTIKQKKTIIISKPVNTFNTLPKPKFDFYTVLPHEQIDIAKLSPQNNSTEQYYLQVATVQDSNDADHLKAELALLGFDIYVNQIRENNNTYYKINVGPYFSLKAARANQKRLSENNIKSELKEIKKK